MLLGSIRPSYVTPAEHFNFTSPPPEVMRGGRESDFSPIVILLLNISIEATMKKLFIVFCLLLFGSPAFAQDLLIVRENNRYDDVLKVFYDSLPVKSVILHSRGLSRANVVVKIKRAKPRLVLALGPEALEKADQATIPIFYIGVENTAPYDGRKNITGISTGIPAVEQIKHFQKVIPSIKRLGIVYSTLSSPVIDAAKRFKGIELVKIEAPHLKDSVPAITDVFKEGIDAFWVIPDIGVYYPEMRNYLYRLSFQNRVPILTTVPQFQREGAVVSLEIDYEEMGKKAGEMVVDILNGEWTKPTVAAFDTRVNTVIAGKMGINFEKEWVTER